MRRAVIVAVWLCLLGAVSASAQVARVKVDKTPLRSAPSASASMVDILMAGTTLDVLQAETVWLKVRDRVTRREGYVLASELEIKGGAPRRPEVSLGSARPAPPPTAAAARASRSWTDAAYLSFNGTYQKGARSFSDTYTSTQYLEQASVSARYPTRDGPGFSVGGGYRVWKALAVGLDVTQSSVTTKAKVEGSFPHPFFFNKPRIVSGTAPGLTHEELALHVQALGGFPVGRRLLVLIGAGPSYFRVRQGLVTEVVPSETYPFDEATIATVATRTASASKVGFNAGIDFSCLLTSSVGIGLLVRYSSARVSLPGLAGSVALDAGGASAGLGLRIRFAKRSSRPPTRPQPPKPPVRK